jgi:hypothetical protein
VKRLRFTFLSFNVKTNGERANGSLMGVLLRRVWAFVGEYSVFSFQCSEFAHAGMAMHLNTEH